MTHVWQRVRILWRLRRDFDADLMAYRGWCDEELDLEYFTRRLKRLLGPDGIRRVMQNMARAFEATGVTTREATEAFQRCAAGIRNARYPMDATGNDGTP